MVSITACRERISDRFPMASFVVKVPPDRLFEIACATDPRLFAAENLERRTPTNFSTSRSNGLLRAPAGQATYLVPPDQLRRFAGARRLYYAVAAYRSPQGQDPVVTLSRDRLDQVPSIQIGPDFTGKTLDRGRLLSRDPAPQRYGGAPAAPMMWGGDLLTPAAASSTGRRLGSPASALDYDDGFDEKLWREERKSDRDEDARAEQDGDPDRYGSPRGELAGWEDAPALATLAAEPAGLEDGADVWRRYGGQLPTAAPLQAPRRFGDGAGDPPPNCWALPPSVTLLASAPVVESPELYGSRSGRAAAVDEGYEDAPDLARNLGPDRLRFGARAKPQARAFGRFPGYSDSEIASEPLPALRPGTTAAPSFDSQDPRQRLRILHRVAVAESGADTYRAVNPDREYEDPELTEFYHRRHVGLSWGFIQFTQRYGSLGLVLSACNRRDPAAFSATFGAHNAADPAVDPATLPAGHLLRVTNAPVEDDRLAPVTPPAGGPSLVLWDPAWVAAFQTAGGLRPFQEAQREIADRRYYAPYLDFLHWLGFDSVRAHAVFVDRAIHMGGGAAMQWLASAVGPIQSQADLASALERLGFPDLRAFQMTPPAGVTRWLDADGVFGPRTHAALLWALRQLGDPSTRLATLDEMLATLCDEATRRAELTKGWKLAAQRLRALKDDPTLDRLPPEPRGEEPAPR